MDTSNAHTHAQEIVIEMIRKGTFPERMEGATNEEQAQDFAEQITKLHKKLYEYFIKEVK
jgi:hypothetical protein